LILHFCLLAKPDGDFIPFYSINYVL